MNCKSANRCSPFHFLLARPRRTVDSRFSASSDRMTRSNRSKSSKKDKKKKQPQMEVAEDGFGVNDRLSRLPDLVLLDFLKHVKRSDIENVRTVNERLRKLSTETTLDSVKWQKGRLQIRTTEEGYGFRLDVRDTSCYPIDKYDGVQEGFEWYEYLVAKQEDGSVAELKKRNHRDRMMRGQSERHDWDIPNEFFTALADILRHHALAHIRICTVTFTLIQIPLTADFMEKLSTVLRDVPIEGVLFYGTGGERITGACRERFARLVKNIKEVHLDQSPHLAALIDENMLRTLAAAVPDRRLYFYVHGSDEQSVQAYQFRVAEGTLPSILQFKVLLAPSMVVDSRWVMKLCLMHMDSCLNEPFTYKHWQFAINGPVFHADSITAQLLGTRYTLESKIINHFHNNYRNTLHYYIRTTGELAADICPMMYGGMQRSVIIHIDRMKNFESLHPGYTVVE